MASVDRGTGAAPQSLLDHMGLPVQHNLQLGRDNLLVYGLRDRIQVICSGK